MASPEAEPMGSGGGDRTDVAKERGGEVAEHARDRGREVAGTAQQEAGRVVDEARVQAGNVLQEAREELQAQADDQTHRASDALSGLGERVQALAEGRPEEAGPIGDYAQSIANQVQDVADRVEELGFDGVIEETQRFARRRPGAFLLGAAVAGFAASRLGRGAKDAQERTGPPDRTDARLPATDRTGARAIPAGTDRARSTQPPAVDRRETRNVGDEVVR